MDEFESVCGQEPAAHDGIDPKALVGAMDQFDRYLRIAIFGLDSAATANLVNFIVADYVLPSDSGLNVPVRFRFAKNYAVRAKTSDGDATQHEINELPRLLDEASSLTVGAPLEALRKLRILRHVAQDQAALEAVNKRNISSTDLTMLCSETFGEAEYQFWSSLPALAREKGYHILPASAEVPNRARKLLAGVIRIDIEAAMEIRKAPGGLDREAFAETGGMDLISAVRQELKWHESSIEEAAVALAHGAIDMPAPKAELAAPFAPEEAETQVQTVERAASVAAESVTEELVVDGASEMPVAYRPHAPEAAGPSEGRAKGIILDNNDQWADLDEAPPLVDEVTDGEGVGSRREAQRSLSE